MANRFTKRGRRYFINGTPCPSVTSVVGVLDKPALIDWAARETAAYAVDNWDHLTELPISRRQAELEKARWAKNRAAIAKGHDLHTMAEQLITGEATPPEDQRPTVEAIARFLDDWEMEKLHTETPVANITYHYAGTLDVIMQSTRLGRILLDWKTGAGVWPEVSLQLAGYRFAEIMLTDHGELPMVQVEGCYVGHVLPDAVQLIPVRADEDTWETFLHLREAHHWRQTTDPKSELFDSPVGDPLFVEQVTA